MCVLQCCHIPSHVMVDGSSVLHKLYAHQQLAAFAWLQKEAAGVSVA